MKTFLLLLGLLFVLQSTAQNSNLEIGKSYIFNANVRVLEYDLLEAKTLSTNKKIAKKNHIFTLEKTIEYLDSQDVYIIKFWKFNEGGKQSKERIELRIEDTKRALEGAKEALANIKEIDSTKKKIKKAKKEVLKRVGDYAAAKALVTENSSESKFIGVESNEKFYAISASDFIVSCIEYKKNHGVSFGALLLPIKLRFWEKERTRFDFSKDVTLGTSIGYKWGFNKKKSHYVNALLGLGITSVSVDSLSSGGFVNNSTELGAFSLSIGCLFEFENVQAGLFVGMDLMGRKAGDKWVYQNMPWFSVGIGYQILSDNLKKEPVGQNH